MEQYKIIISPKTAYLKAINDCFKKEAICKLGYERDIKIIENIATSLLDTKNVILFNLTNENNLLLNMLPRNQRKILIMEYSVSQFSIPTKYNEILLALNYLDKKMIDEIYCLDYNLYMLFKDKYNFKYLKLDVAQDKNSTHIQSNSIGLLSDPSSHYSNVMNELSAISMTDYKEVKLLNPIKSVTGFAKRFKLKRTNVKNVEDVITDNELNLYIKFSEICYTLILESMDKGIPCIVGNSDLFDSNEKLKKALVVESDDDINEIKEKIINVSKNKKEIIKEYAKFRKVYSNMSKKSIDEFMNNLK